MQLLPNNELAIRVRNPAIVVAHIPHAKLYQNNVVVVPHKLEETKVLRNLGVPVPSPILSTYEWPRAIDIPNPFAHQLQTAAFLTLYNRCFALLEMGLGKTLAALWAADWLMRHGFVRRTLICCTMSCLDATWEREIFRNLMHRTSIVLHGKKSTRIAGLKEDVDFYILNHHGILVMEKELPTRTDIDLVIMDEVAILRKSTNENYKAFAKYLRPHQRLWILTGKPCPGGPEDAWAPTRLVAPDRVPPFFTRWKDQTMRQVRKFKWVPREDAKERMHDAMQPAIRFAKKDCLDLPPTSYVDRHCSMSDLQIAWYAAMKTKLVIYAQQHKITAGNAAILMSKLLQICAGAIKTDQGEYLGLDVGPRYAVLDEVIEQASAKIIVMVPYTGALRLVAHHMGKHGSTAIIDGSTSRSKRRDILAGFQDHAHPQSLVCHPQVAAHGLNLTRADNIVWWSPIHSLDIYDQANERMARPGQKLNTTITRISGCPLERAVYKVLDTRGADHSAFLDLFEQELQV